MVELTLKSSNFFCWTSTQPKRIIVSVINLTELILTLGQCCRVNAHIGLLN